MSLTLLLRNCCVDSWFKLKPLPTVGSRTVSLIVFAVFSLTDSPFRRKLESAIQSSLVDTNSSQNSSGEHKSLFFF